MPRGGRYLPYEEEFFSTFRKFEAASDRGMSDGKASIERNKEGDQYGATNEDKQHELRQEGRREGVRGRVMVNRRSTAR